MAGNGWKRLLINAENIVFDIYMLRYIYKFICDKTARHLLSDILIVSGYITQNYRNIVNVGIQLSKFDFQSYLSILYLCDTILRACKFNNSKI